MYTMHTMCAMHAMWTMSPCVYNVYDVYNVYMVYNVYNVLTYLWYIHVHSHTAIRHEYDNTQISLASGGLHIGIKCRFNRVFSKRPIGILAAWLDCAFDPTMASFEDHQEAKVSQRAEGCYLCYDKRLASRESLLGLPELAEVFALEAESAPHGTSWSHEPERLMA